MWWRLYWKPNLVFIVCVCLPSFSCSTGQDENRHCEKSCIHWFLCFYEHFCCRFVWVGPEKRGDCGVLKIFRSTNFNQNLCWIRSKRPKFLPGYQYAIRKETSLGPHNMTRYLVPPRKYSPYTVCTGSAATGKCAPHAWPLGCCLWELRGRAPQKSCWLCVDRFLASS